MSAQVPDPTQAPSDPSLDSAMAALHVEEPASSAAGEEATDAVPPHRSHDPATSSKQTEPFKFGSRILKENDDVFEFNAWDHVETDDAYKEYSEVQYAKQREAPVSDFDKQRFNSDPAKWWNIFYKNNTANFFKNRKWLRQEFPILSKVTQEDSGPATLLEVGAGAGNTAFPILAHNKNPCLKIHACDFSKQAVQVMRSSDQYNTENMQADVWDAAGTELPPDLSEGSVDVVLMIFIFSALSPEQWKQAVSNVYRLLKPGGEVLFRDYGRGDLAQVRFKKGRYMQENFYVRGDGTRVYFFEQDELAAIWSGEGAAESAKDEESSSHASPSPSSSSSPSPASPSFEIVDLGVDRRLLVNRAKQIKMYRCWLQGRFRKPDTLPPS